MKLILSGVVVGIIASLAGCGGGGGGGGIGGGPPLTDITGTWAGSWFSTQGQTGGSVNLMIVQTGNQASGSVTFTNSPCFAGGPIAGLVSGVNLSASLIAGGIHIDFSAAVSGAGFDNMNGTYGVVSGGACTGDTGTVTLNRIAPVTIGGDGSGETLTGVTFIYDDHGNRLATIKSVKVSEDR